MFPGFDFEFESDEENLNDRNRFRLWLRSHLLFIRSTQRDVGIDDFQVKTNWQCKKQFTVFNLDNHPD